MTLDDIQRELKVSRRTVYRWIKLGNLRAIKVGGGWRVKEETFKEFLELSNWSKKEEK